MEWSDTGIVLRARPHSEAHAVADLLTEHHGRYSGLVRGGAGRRMRPVIEPGNLVSCVWRARLAEHLGTYSLELLSSRAAAVLTARDRLLALTAACAVAAETLPEREPHPAAFGALNVLVEHLENDEIWPVLFVKWELGLLKELGFGLDLQKCAATGARRNLTHVSPKSGRAVCADAAEPYRDKLLPLPAFLIDSAIHPESQDLRDGLALTGYFLESRLLNPADKPLPEPRRRLEGAFAEAERGLSVEPDHS